MNPKTMMTEDEVEATRKLVQDGGKVPGDTILRALDTIDALALRAFAQKLSEAQARIEALESEVASTGAKLEVEKSQHQALLQSFDRWVDQLAVALPAGVRVSTPDEGVAALVAWVEKLRAWAEPFRRVGEVLACFSPPYSQRIQGPVYRVEHPDAGKEAGVTALDFENLYQALVEPATESEALEPVPGLPMPPESVQKLIRGR